PRRGDVPRTAGGIGRQAGAVRTSPSSVYRSAPVGGAHSRPQQGEASGANHSEGGGSQPDQSSERLPVPHPLPQGDGHLRGGGSRLAGSASPALGGLPPVPGRGREMTEASSPLGKALRLMTNPLALFARKAPGVACLWG